MTKTFLFDLELDGNRTFLEKQREFNCRNRFESYDLMVDFLNKNLKLNKMAREHMYAFALNYNLNPLGLYEISCGSNVASLNCTRELFIFLLMVGAEQFVVFHNHPSGSINASQSDINTSNTILNISKIIGIKFLEHIIIARNKWQFVDKKLYDPEYMIIPQISTNGIDNNNIPEISMEGIK